MLGGFVRGFFCRHPRLRKLEAEEPIDDVQGVAEAKPCKPRPAKNSLDPENLANFAQYLIAVTAR